MSLCCRRLFKRVPNDYAHVTCFDDNESNMKKEDDERKQNVKFDCSAFLDAIDVYKKQLKGQTKLNVSKLFQLPEHLQDLANIYLFYEIQKEIHFKHVPQDVTFVNMLHSPDKEIAFINRLICDKTKGLFEKVDPKTEMQLRHPEFRYLLLGIFYLKAKWNGQDDGTKQFCNQNGQKPILPFFKLDKKRVTFENKQICVRVAYEIENGKPLSDSYVIFSKPCSKWDKNDKYVNIHLPKLNLEGRQEIESNHLGKIIVNFKYKQDEHGFEAACLYGEDGVDGETKPIKDVVFDEPFQIDIYHKNVIVFQVQVFDL